MDKVEVELLGSDCSAAIRDHVLKCDKYISGWEMFFKIGHFSEDLSY